MEGHCPAPWARGGSEWTPGFWASPCPSLGLSFTLLPWEGWALCAPHLWLCYPTHPVCCLTSIKGPCDIGPECFPDPSTSGPLGVGLPPTSLSSPTQKRVLRYYLFQGQRYVWIDSQQAFCQVR
jgi:hypothetical protein